MDVEMEEEIICLGSTELRQAQMDSATRASGARRSRCCAGTKPCGVGAWARRRPPSTASTSNQGHDLMDSRRTGPDIVRAPLSKAEIERMLTQGVFEHSMSEWASPVVIVP